MLEKYDISMRPVPPRRHEKNMIEPRHGVIRSIYMRIRDQSISPKIAAIEAIKISNDLYGNDVMSAFEIAKGFSRPICNQSIKPVDNELIEAHDNLCAKRKMNKILRSHSYDRNVIRTGDLVQVYIKNEKQKRGSWSSPRQVLAIDHDGGFVVVPGRGSRKISAAFEDTRIAPGCDQLSVIIQSAVDELDESVDDIVSIATINDVNGTKADESSDGASMDVTDFSSDERRLPSEGDRIQVFWPLDNAYYSGEVINVNDDGNYMVLYDDEETETVKITDEQWRYEADVPQENLGTDTLQGGALEVVKTLTSNHQEVIQSMMDKLGQRPFMYHHAQGFDQSAMIKSYDAEEEKYISTVKRVPRRKVPRDANIVSSHVVYRIKVEDDDSLRLKARIAPHGNEDSDIENLKTDCCMCPPSGIRVITVTATVRTWRIVKIDVEMAFHQSGKAERNVYVIPPKDSRLRNEYWLLLVAGYGLINSNAKWQFVSDNSLLQIGLKCVPEIQQLFVKHDENGNLILLVIKIVDDILATGPDIELRKFVSAFGDIFKLGTIRNGPGKMRYFGMNVLQFDDFSCQIDCDDKLNALEGYPLARIRRSQADNTLNTIEKRAFMSLNSSISWLGTVSSPLCAFYASYLQQKLPECKVKSMISQLNSLNILKRYGTLTMYPKPKSSVLNLVAFADASHSPDTSQLCYLIGIVYGEVKQGSVFHLLTWTSHKSRRPVKSTPAAEIMAASEALDELIPLRDAFQRIVGTKVVSWELVDSKDLYNSLTTQRNSVDKSIRSEVNCI